MKFLKKILCRKETQEEEKPDKDEEHTRRDRYCRAKKVREKSQTLREFWNKWPNQEEEEVNRETKTTGFEIPVYEIQVNFNDGETEVYKHESFTSPSAKKLEEIKRVDVGKSSYMYSKSKDNLTKRNVRTETLAAFNRDNINSVKILDKNERITELEYELVKTEVTEKKGSIRKREEMPHLRGRMWNTYRNPPDAEFEWQYPETERQLIMKIVDENSLEHLLDSKTVSQFEAENVEVAQNE